MGIFSGQKIQVLTYQNRIELIPIKPMKKMKGLLKGIDTEVGIDIKIAYERRGFISLVILFRWR